MIVRSLPGRSFGEGGSGVGRVIGNADQFKRETPLALIFDLLHFCRLAYQRTHHKPLTMYALRVETISLRSPVAPSTLNFFAYD